MEAVFVLQKRPARGMVNGFYYRIVNVQTGDPFMANFVDVSATDSRAPALTILKRREA
ncbi:hypothetical protein [Pseudomonas sp. NPDC089569]|uniref:hypothetical protein n=1 Tax=Pseudomonas sp. NPDC089569 TaxID=3390722 RepID=UPI003D0296C9